MQSCITALFPMGDDVGEALAMAANSVGLKEMPLYEVEDLLDQDWVQQVEVSFYFGFSLNLRSSPYPVLQRYIG
jgi:hypothetical protein